MQTRPHHAKLTLSPLLPLMFAATLAACGGGDSDVPAAAGTGPTSVKLTGLAATGAALAGATVTAKCTAGADTAGTTAADGSFTLTLGAAQVAPCLLKVVGGSPSVTLYSYAAGAGRVNITPWTDLIVARAAASSPAAAFAAFDLAKGNAITAALAAAKAYVVTEAVAIAGAAPAADVLTGLFAVGDADDKLLDTLGAALKAAGKAQGDLDTAASSGASLKAVLSTAAPSSGAIGSGAYAQVTAKDSADFLALLPKACAVVSTLANGAKTYSKCKQDSSSVAVNLTAAMWYGGLPHPANSATVSGPNTAGAKVFVVNALTDVAVGNTCKVAIAEPFIPIVEVEVRAAIWATVSGKPFNFNGTVDDTVSVDKDGLVFEYTMTNSASYKIEMHPNLTLFDPKTTGSEGVVGSPGNASYFICQS